MKQINLGLDKSKKYVVACSFGPDSMALLSLAIRNKLNIVVVHVNYRKRPESSVEQAQLEDFCKKNNLKIYVLDLLNQKAVGNFQDWARKVRYEFFKEVAGKVGAEAVLVAHQQDDVLETYLMQKNQGKFAKNPGISDKIEVCGVQIVRPLLRFSKEELKQFDDDNNIPYAIDSSNLTNDYTRNKIRHDIVEKLTLKERKSLLEEIENIKIDSFVFKTRMSREEFLSLDYSKIVALLDHYMNILNEHRDLSKSFVEEIKKGTSQKQNFKVDLTESLLFESSYGDVYLVNKKRLCEYRYEFNETFKNEFLDIDFFSGAEDRNITLNGSKLIVKNLNKIDRLIIRNYSKDISRLFIDWKMPYHLRKIWPGIYDENNQLLYVPRYRKKFVDNHKSKFEINTDFFIKF